MIKKILKELEPFVITNQNGNKSVKEDDVTKLSCKYALTPDFAGRLHEALELLRIEIIPYDSEENADRLNDILSAFKIAHEATEMSICDLNDKQKEVLSYSIDKLILRLKNMYAEISFRSRKNSGTKSGISANMRDFVWELVKKHRGKIHVQDLADTVAQQTGMNPNSAFIYISMLSNLLKGQKNTRTMKFDDLIYYLDQIKIDCSHSEYENALISLQNSIPYWRVKITGNFAQKAARLLDRLKSDN